MSNAEQPSDNSTPLANDSFWKKPRLYLTVVALYLLSTPVFMAILVIYTIRSTWDGSDGGGHGSGLAGFVYLAVFGWLFILMLIAIASASLLFRRHKNGVYLSLAALVLTALSLPLSVFYFVNSYILIDTRDVLMNIILQLSVYASIILTIAMFAPLIVAWKRVERV